MGASAAKQTVTGLPSYLLTLRKRIAFTLAETLITLGIIGVVAAITMPTVIANVQRNVLNNQFKSAYTKFFNALMLTQTNLDMPISCSYWTDTPYTKPVDCKREDPVYGTCIEYSYDGGPLPQDLNGPREDCALFEQELFTKTLKAVKFCEDNALANGCITDAYRGVDKVKAEQNPDAEFPPNPNTAFSDSNIKNNYSSWVLADGTVIMKFGKYKSKNHPIYTVDINGHKGPNKWGYDLFTFRLLGDRDGLKKLDGSWTYAVEKGGYTTADMMQRCFSN